MTGQEANIEQATLAHNFGSIASMNIVQEVTCAAIYEVAQGEWELGNG